MGQITIMDVGVVVTFLVSLISGIAYLKKNLTNWVKAAMKDDMQSVCKKIDLIQNEMIDMKTERARDRADAARYNILRFNDEVLHGTKHTKEHFEQVLSDTDNYEKYCREDPDYPNSKAVGAIKNIRAQYEKCSMEGTFL